MKNALEKLRELATSPRHDYRNPLVDFPSLNVETISSNLELAEKGAGRGTNNLPGPQDSDFDVVENTIIDRINDELKDAVEQYTGQVDICGERVRDLNFEALVTDAKGRSRDAIADFEREAQNGRNHLFQARRRLVEATEALNRFRLAHNLTRPAHTQGGFWSTHSVIITLLAVEISANAGLMGEAYASGYLGAFSFAIALAVLNVGVGLLAGLYALRSIYHRGLLRKFLGGIGLVLYVVMCFFFNFYVAHVRDALQSGGMDTALARVWPRVLAADVSFTDFQAPVMLFIGIIFSLFAFIKGFGHDDPYPDYGRQSRLREKCETAYAQEAQAYTNFLSDMRDGVSDALTNLAYELSDRRNDYYAISSTLSRLDARFNAHQKHLETAANRLLEIYRDENRKARKSKPPRHFSVGYKLGSMAVDSPLLANVFTKEKIEDLSTKGQTVIESAIEDINSAYERAYRQYLLIEKILSKEDLESASEVGDA